MTRANDSGGQGAGGSPGGVEASRAFAVREAGPEDDAFLFELFCTTRREEIAGWNWPVAEQQAFLETQHRFQRESYASQYPRALNRIVLAGGERVGRILTARSEEALALIDLAILPACRNHGIGTALIRGLQATATAEKCGVRLHVLAYSPARRLYARLGFSEAGGSLPYVRMEWHPVDSATVRQSADRPEASGTAPDGPGGAS